MILIGANMMNRKYLLGLFSIFFLTTIFAEENRTLWDFGVIIKTPVQQNSSEKSIQFLSNSEIESSFQVKALISDPFIPPTVTSLDEIEYDTPIILESLDNISFNNIHQIKLLAGRLTMQINYQPIIDLISQVDFSQLDDNDCMDLNYWLANAYLQTGQYTEAEDVILANMTFTKDDRFHFLLAMTYESQNKIEVAREEYLRFIKQFPKSDYKMTALIKARMLGRR